MATYLVNYRFATTLTLDGYTSRVGYDAGQQVELDDITFAELAIQVPGALTLADCCAEAEPVEVVFEPVETVEGLTPTAKTRALRKRPEKKA
jgi:hypothetical protein